MARQSRPDPGFGLSIAEAIAGVFLLLSVFWGLPLLLALTSGPQP